MRGLGAVGLWPLLTGTLWKPEAQIFGGLPLIVGTLVSALGAIAVGALPAIATALWVTEFAPPSIRYGYRRVMEVSAAVPSVVFGWLALTNLVPLLDRVAHALAGEGAAVTGEGLATSAILLAVMTGPTIVLLSLDALGRVPAAARDASSALGATRWQTAMNVVLPWSRRGLMTAVFFGFARAAGETMAVQMVIGGARIMPKGLFSPTTTISAQIVSDMQNARPGTPESNVLFSMSLLLLVVSTSVVLATRLLSREQPS